MNQEQFSITKAFFEQLGISRPEELDPYHFGNHGLRYYLWAVLDFIEIPPRSTREYLTGNSYTAISNIFRHLDSDDMIQFQNELSSYRIKLKTIPKK
jgi:hypothetical protein